MATGCSSKLHTNNQTQYTNTVGNTMKVPHVKHYVKNEGTAHEQHELRIHFQPSMLSTAVENYKALDLLVALSKLEPHQLLLPATDSNGPIDCVEQEIVNGKDVIFVY